MSTNTPLHIQATADPAGGADGDVADPHRRSDDVRRQVVHEPAPAVDALLPWTRQYR